MMDTDIIVRKKRDLLTMSFMRSTAKPNSLKIKKPTSPLEMTREEFKQRLNQHKSNNSDKVIH